MKNSPFRLLLLFCLSMLGPLSYGQTAQTIDFTTISPSGTLEYFDPPEAGNFITLQATASSGLPVTFSSNNPAVAGVLGNQLTLVGTGVVTITASQAGGTVGVETFNPATASQVLTVVDALDPQTITWDQNLNNITFSSVGQFFPLTATSSSGLPVSFSVLNGTETVTVTGDTMQIFGAGPVTLQAVQAGDDTFAPASPVSRSFTIAKGSQEITFFGDPDSASSGSISDKTIGGSNFTIRVESNSSISPDIAVKSVLPVSRNGQSIRPLTLEQFQNDEDASGTAVDYIYSISGNRNQTALVTLEATLPGNAGFEAGATLTRQFYVRVDPTVQFEIPEIVTVGTAPQFVNATSSSGLPVILSVGAGPGLLVPGTVDQFLPTGQGPVSINGTVQGNIYDPSEAEAVLYNTFTTNSIVSADFAGAAPGPGTRDTWANRFPDFEGSGSMNGSAVNNSGTLFVAVGDGGRITRSTDTLAWGGVSSGVSVDLLDVAYGGGRFIAVGDSGTMVSSIDGLTWNPVNLPGVGAGDSLTSVAYGVSSGFVATAFNGSTSYALSSPDGISWSGVVGFPGFLPRINAVRYLPGRDAWVAVGQRGSVAVKSSGSSEWRVGFIGTTENYNDVHETSEGMAFIVGSDGSILRSVDIDLAQWEKEFSGSSYSFEGITSGNGVIVALGQSGRAVVSVIGGGEFWEETTSAYPADFTSITYSGFWFIATGSNGSVSTSASGYDWTQRYSDTSYAINDAAETGTNLIAVGGQKTVLVSGLDGESWSLVNNLPGSISPTTEFYGIATNNDEIVIVGSQGNAVFSANNGASWADISAFVTLSGANYTGSLRKVIYDGNQYLAVGDSLSIFRLDTSAGLRWVQLTSGLANGSFNDIIFDGVRYLAIGDFGTIYTSGDGNSWSQIFSGATDDFYGIASGGNGYIIVGKNGRMLQSTNGTSWSRLPSPTTLDLYAINYVSGRFTTVGEGMSIFSTVDGINWSEAVNRTRNVFSNIRFLNESYYAIGQYATIVSSSTPLPSGLDQWTIRNPIAEGANINDVDFGNDVFVAVGSGGLVMISDEGQNWRQISVFENDGSLVTQNLLGVAYGNGIYLAVGGQKLLVSRDAENWEVVTTWVANATSISYGQGVFVVTAEDAHLFTSSDGINWLGGFQTFQATEADFLASHYSEELGLWVATGEASPFPLDPSDQPDMTMVFTSPDGYAWERHIMPLIPGTDDEYFASPMRAAAYGDGRFLLSGDGGLTSSSGSEWSINHFGWSANASVYVEEGEPGFRNVGPQGLVMGFYPFFLSFPGIDESFNGITYGQGIFVAVGNGGSIINSRFGREWSQRATGNFNPLNAVVSSPVGRQITVGNNANVLYSSNGDSWTRSTGLPSGLFGTVSYNGVEYAPGQSGAAGTIATGFYASGNNGAIIYSTDGEIWDTRVSNVTASLKDIAYGVTDVLVAVGAGGTIVTTLDGQVWNEVTGVTERTLNGIDYGGDGNGQFIAVGAGNTLVGGATGGTWIDISSRLPSGTADLFDVAHGIASGQQAWIIVGQSGLAYTSIDDGQTWQTVETGTLSDLTSVEYGNGNFTAVGAGGEVLSTNDLKNWYRRPIGTDFALNGIGFTGSEFTMVGDFNTILTSATVVNTSESGRTQLIDDIVPNAIDEFSGAPQQISAVSLDAETMQPTGLPVFFELVSGPAVLNTVDGITTLTLQEPGSIVIRAFNNGGTEYASVSQQISYVIPAAEEEIIIEKIPNKLLDDPPFEVVAQTSAGEDIDLEIISGKNIASLRSERITDLSGNSRLVHTITLKGEDDAQGYVTLAASLPSGSSSAALPTEAEFYVSKFEQVVEFVDPGEKVFGDGSFDLNAAAEAGGDVTFRLADASEVREDGTQVGLVADLRGNTVTIKRAGTIVVVAEAPPVGDFGPAETDFTINVAKAPQEINFGTLEDQFAIPGTRVPLRAQTFINNDEDPASSADYPIVFSIVRGSEFAEIDSENNVLILNGQQGQITVQATQVGNFSVEPASAVQQTISSSAFARVPFTGDAAMYGSAFGNGTHVAVGDQGFIFRSLNNGNPRAWEFVAGPTTLPLYDIAFGNDTFVAVGFNGTALTSPDGINWTESAMPVPFLVNAVTFGNGVFTAMSSGGVGFTSGNGVSWAQTNLPSNSAMVDVAYGQTPDGSPMFVAVGSAGTILSSPDGSNWTTRDSGTQLELNGVAYGDGLFVIIGDLGTYLFSDDGGTTWQRRSIPQQLLDESTSLNSISFGAVNFRAVGPDGLILSATAEAIIEPINQEDLISRWRRDVSVGTNSLNDIAFGGDRFVATGDSVTMIISLPQNALSTAVNAADGYRWSPWMGWMHGASDPWFYHFHLGWIYVQGPEDSLWMFSPDFGWIWTSQQIFPWIFMVETNTWYFYAEESVGPRYFYNTATEAWEAR